MSISSSDYEKLGQFYLGCSYDQEEQAATDELLLYDSKDLVTHGVVLGMTGSGKTGLCLALLEEAAMDHIPAIIIDPKGDIANLLLTFPDLAPSDFLPWISPEEAAKQQISPEELAKNTAQRWEKGLADWGQSPDRIRQMRENVDITIFTPASQTGIPVSIISSLNVPPQAVMDDAEAFTDHLQAAVSSIFLLAGVDGDDVLSPEAVFLSALLQSEWLAGRGHTLESLIFLVQRPTLDRIGVIALDKVISPKNREKLALKFNNLFASPGYQAWLQGVPLNIDAMMRTDAGKPRMSIFSIAHLDDNQRMFFVTMLLSELIMWMRSQPGTTSLRALFYMDEIFGYLPPTANPASKRLMMLLLKQARAFGLGVLLATQNPVDLDYKALSNIGTWFLGRLQTERDQARVLDGIQSASDSQNAKFDRREMEKILASLKNRVFLMNNVHDDGPQLFQSRWAMSFLTGPLTRTQIKTLMDPRREEFAEKKIHVNSFQPTTNSNPMLANSSATTAIHARPYVEKGIPELFVDAPSSEPYQPYLFRQATVHFSGENGEHIPKTMRLIEPITPDSIDRENPLTLDDSLTLRDEPDANLGFLPLPAFASQLANFKQVGKEFVDSIYRESRVPIWFCAALKTRSNPDEPEGTFRARLSDLARAQRDEAVEKLRAANAKKIDSLHSKLQTASLQYEKEKNESRGSWMQAGLAAITAAASMLGGRKTFSMTSISRAGTTLSKIGSANKQRQDVNIAEEKMETLQQEIAALQAQFDEDVAKIDANTAPDSFLLEQEFLKPKKTDIALEKVGILWAPADFQA